MTLKDGKLRLGDKIVQINGVDVTDARHDQVGSTVCPGSSDPPEKIFHTFASENEVHTIY